MNNLIKHFIGYFIKTYIARSTDTKIRENSASGGVATALLMHLFREGIVDVILVPRRRFKQGLTYGVWTILKDLNEINTYSGSLYAPVYGLSKVLNYALSKFRRIAITAIPCHAKAIRRILKLRGRSEDVFIIGLYCNNTPDMWATRYALKYFGIRAEDVEWIKFRGQGWPGYTVIKKKNKTIRIPFLGFWDSGFGQYFYGLGCYSCADQTNVSADISLADPWTLPHEHIKRLGGATLVITRSLKGQKVLESAMNAGYIEAVEVDPVYAIQHTTLLRVSKRVLKKSRKTEYRLPPGFTTIAHEVLYRVGSFLARKESLWPLLKVYHKVVAPSFSLLSFFLDCKLIKTRWGRIHENMIRIQRLKVSKNAFIRKLRI